MSDDTRASQSLTQEGVQVRKEMLEAAEVGNYSLAEVGLKSHNPRVRATSISVLSKNGLLNEQACLEASEDLDPLVRRSVAEAATTILTIPLINLLQDPDFTVVEISCWAAGERGDQGDGVIQILSEITVGHEDALCREAAVAALGALGNPNGLQSILVATEDIATVRRRAILALAPFDNDETKKALNKALEDRDWQVRQAAEDLVIEE